MLQTIMNGIRKLTEWAVISLFATIVVVVFYQVFSRYLFHNPPSWSEEVARFCQVWMIMLASPMCIREGCHLAVDYLSGAFSPWINNFIQFVINVLILFYIPFIAFFGYKLTLIGQFQTSPALQLNMFFIYLIFPLSGTLMLIESAIKTYRIFRNFSALREGN